MTVPIILAHGIFRIDALRVLARDRLGIDHGVHYFLGIAPFLQKHGFTVVESDVSFNGSVEKRAAQLAKVIAKFDRVAVIAHSMGGLDTRKAIVDHGMAGKVVSLTTIGTPHHGTPAADHLERLGGPAAIAQLKELIDFEGFNDLATAKCEAFNKRAETIEADNNVRYRVVTAHEDFAHTTVLLQATSALLPASDGIVPVSSQRWTTELKGTGGKVKTVPEIRFPIGADHLNEIGWWDHGALLGGLLPGAFAEKVNTFYLELARTA